MFKPLNTLIYVHIKKNGEPCHKNLWPWEKQKEITGRLPWRLEFEACSDSRSETLRWDSFALRQFPCTSSEDFTTSSIYGLFHETTWPLFAHKSSTAMNLSPFVTWPFPSLCQSEVSLWIWQSPWWSPHPRPASGCSAAPLGGPSVTYGPGLRGAALSGLAVKGLLAGTPSSDRWAWTVVEPAAVASAEWSALFCGGKGEEWRNDRW